MLPFSIYWKHFLSSVSAIVSLNNWQQAILLIGIVTIVCSILNFRSFVNSFLFAIAQLQLNVSMWLSLIYQTCPPIWIALLEAIFQCWWLGCFPGFLSGEYKYSWSKLVRDKVISKSSVHEKGNPSHIPRYILKVIIPKEMDIEPSIHTIYQNLLQSFFILCLSIFRKFSLIFVFSNVLLPYVSVGTKLYTC
jgi:hypothetical protein